MGLFTNIVEAVDRRIRGSAKSTVGEVKDRIFRGTAGRGGFYNAGGKLGSIVQSDFDARAMSSPFAKTDFAQLGTFKLSSPSVKNEQNPSAKYYVRLDYKNHIEGMPPMADNIVDPPPFMQEAMFRSQATSFESGLVGKKYAKLVMERGSYLSLTPLKLDPSPFKTMILGGSKGNLLGKLKDSLWGSVNIPSYGFDADIATEAYWRDVCVHARASLMLLGLGTYTTKDMELFLPKHICDKLGDRFSAMKGEIIGTEWEEGWLSKAVKFPGKVIKNTASMIGGLSRSGFEAADDFLSGGKADPYKFAKTKPGQGKAIADQLMNKAKGDLANANKKAKEKALTGTYQVKSNEILAVDDSILGDNKFWDQNTKKALKKANPYPLSKFGKKANELAKKAGSLQNKFNQLKKGYADVVDTATKKAKELDKWVDSSIKNAKEGLRAFMGTHGGDVGLALYDRMVGTAVDQGIDGVKKLGSNLLKGAINGNFEKIPGLQDLYQAGYDNNNLNDQSVINFMKYILNADPETINKGLPFVTFYCDGPIEKNYSSSLDLQESELSAATVQYWKDQMGKLVTAGLQKIKGFEMLGGDPETFKDAWKELRFHNYHDGSWVGFNLSSQIVIPKIIKGSTLGETYTANIRLLAVGTDRWSLFRLHFAICKLIPFFIVKNEQDSQEKYIIPQQPYYCAAFSKGVMNLPRAAIESINIKTDATYNTTEGIASDITISINIVPLINVATSPKLRRFTANDTPEAIITSMFNPTSSFNLLATLAGHNTVFTKIPIGLYEYFVEGNLGAYVDNVSNIMRIASNAYQDYTINTNFNYLRRTLTR